MHFTLIGGHIEITNTNVGSKTDSTKQREWDTNKFQEAIFWNPYASESNQYYGMDSINLNRTIRKEVYLKLNYT